MFCRKNYLETREAVLKNAFAGGNRILHGESAKKKNPVRYLDKQIIGIKVVRRHWHNTTSHLAYASLLVKIRQRLNNFPSEKYAFK